jgi:hypothetical protein
MPKNKRSYSSLTNNSDTEENKEKIDLLEASCSDVKYKREKMNETKYFVIYL